jgi:hypothetical protein
MFGHLHIRAGIRLHTGDSDEEHSPPVRKALYTGREEERSPPVRVGRLHTGDSDEEHSPPVARKPLYTGSDEEYAYIRPQVSHKKSKAATDRDNAILAEQRANRDAEQAKNKALMEAYEKDTELKGKTTSGLQQHEYEETFGGAVMQATGAKKVANQKKMTIAEARKAADAQKTQNQLYNARRTVNLKDNTTTGLSQYEYDSSFGGAAQKAAEKAKRK